MSTRIYGNYNRVVGLAASETSVYGTGNTVDLISGSGSVAKFFTAGAANRVNGTGNGIGVWATGETIESSGNTIQFSAGGMSTRIYGDSNYVVGLSASETTVYGTGNTIDLVSSSGSVARFFNAGAANRVTGTGNYIGVWATGETIESSGNSIQFSAGGMSTGIYGNYNHVLGLSSSSGSSGSLPGGKPFSPFKYSQVYFPMLIADNPEDLIMVIMVTPERSWREYQPASLYRGKAVHVDVEEADSPIINAVAELAVEPFDPNVKMPGFSYSDLLHEPGANDIVFDNFNAATKQAHASKEASLNAESDVLYKDAAFGMFANVIQGKDGANLPPSPSNNEQYAVDIGWTNAVWQQQIAYNAELGTH